MESGIQMTLEMFMPTACPWLISGASERLARISPLPDTEQDSKEIEALSLEKYLGFLTNTKKKVINPNGLSTRTLKECIAQTEDSIISQYSVKWTRGGMMRNGILTTRNTTECLRTENASILSDILEAEVQQRYFLSKEQTERIVFKP